MTPLELEQLLIDERWMRALARRVAGRAVDSEDLAQDAWLAWLRNPVQPRELRPWLVRVMRRSAANAVRATVRREAREVRVAQTAPAQEERSAADLTAELELHARLNRALAELEEPQRSTLVRHFHRGESRSQIARADGLALSTVQARVARGLERLRARLDRAYGGQRAAWIGLASELQRAPGGAATWGKLAMATVRKLSAAAVVLGVGGWWLWNSERELDAGLQAAPSVVTTKETSLEPRTGQEAAAPTTERQATEASQSAVPSAPELPIRARACRASSSASCAATSSAACSPMASRASTARAACAMSS